MANLCFLLFSLAIADRIHNWLRLSSGRIQLHLIVRRTERALATLSLSPCTTSLWWNRYTHHTPLPEPCTPHVINVCSFVWMICRRVWRRIILDFLFRLGGMGEVKQAKLISVADYVSRGWRRVCRSQIDFDGRHLPSIWLTYRIVLFCFTIWYEQSVCPSCWMRFQFI